MTRNINDISVIYLARHAEGLDSYRRFIASYKRHPAGYNHDLIVIYKGFDSQIDLSNARAEFSNLKTNEVCVSDEHVDIGAYLEATAQVSTKYVCFFNTHSEILAPDWLRSFRNSFENTDTGIAGAHGSFESLRDSLKIISKAVWLAGVEKIPFDRAFWQYYRFVIDVHVPDYNRDFNRAPSLWARLGRGIKRFASDERWEEYWHSHQEPGGVFEFLKGFPGFPNPHIRSNGFMLRREELLNFFPSIDIGKNAAYDFESGPGSLGIKMIKSGRRLVTVDRNGNLYGQKDWPNGGAFRLGTQSNIIIGDNQTRAFDRFTPYEQQVHALMTWGASFSNVPKRYRLGFSFE